MRKRWLASMGYLIAIASILVNGWQWFQAQNSPSTYLVTDIIDGDTFVTQDHSIIRLFSASAPQLEHCGGEEAKQALSEAVLNKRVSLNVKARDDHGRQIALVYRGKNLVNAELLATGWFTFGGGQADDRDKMKESIAASRDKKIGIFSPKCTQIENPENSDCSIKGNIGQASTNREEKTYHYPGCTYYHKVLIETYRGEEWFCTEKEAQAAGYVKSEDCTDKKFVK